MFKFKYDLFETQYCSKLKLALKVENLDSKLKEIQDILNSGGFNIIDQDFNLLKIEEQKAKEKFYYMNKYLPELKDKL